MTTSNDLKVSSLRLLVLTPNDSSNNEANLNGQISSTNTSSERFKTFLTSLTGIVPSEDLESFAGYTTHPPLNIRNKYYAANVNLWCDELPSLSASNTGPSLTEWSSQMLSAEAQEVREVIGGIIILSSFNAVDPVQPAQVQTTMSYVTEVAELRDAVEDGSGRDVPAILALQDITPSAAADRLSTNDHDVNVNSFVQRLEEACLEEHGIFGWDIVAWDTSRSPSEERYETGDSASKDERRSSSIDDQPSQKTNEFGEKLGMARVIEVLEQVNWSVSDAEDENAEADYDLISTDDFFNDDNDYSMPSLKPKVSARTKGFRGPIAEQSDEFQHEIMGLHFALEEQSGQGSDTDREAGSDMQVEHLSSLMEKAMAVREAGSEMSQADREKFARREVARMMKEMNFDG